MSSIPTREEALFAEALAQPQSERGAFLAKACGGDLDLLAHLVALVAAHEGPESLLVPSGPARAESTLSEKAGEWIGRYRLLQKIGEGGCGVVWMAEQEEPVRRRVALKVIKLGMDTKAVIARFDAERQALAMMDHPNIAKVLDGGATETGRPYFVMELVRGIPITTFCDENQLAPVDRLELFIQACHAVQHAHQKGVIHRDLKPSNILVTVNDGAATPKVIDFGIAKATQGRLTDATVFTAFEQFIGTPVYMSPEQAQMSSLDIDTRSDIYSLGVLLYELLTGRPPFDAKAFARAGVDEIRYQIRETEPPKPSRRLHTLADAERVTVARLRNITPAQLSLLLRGDLDWIVMRCLEKNRTRRYDTANGLAMDIQRHLRNEPVIARPPSSAYLLQKLIRRHRLGFAAATAIFMVLTIGVAVSAWQAIRATAAEHEQSRLRQAAESAQAKEASQRQTAEHAQASEANLRRSAQAQELAARRKAYASDMNGVQQALALDNLGRAQGLLNRQRPQPGQRDLRGWEWRYLWQFCQSDAQPVLCQKSFPIPSVAVSSDGKSLAIGEDSKGGLSVWNLHTSPPQESRVLAGNGFVRAVFSPREHLLAIAVDTGATQANPEFGIWLWNTATGQRVWQRPLGGLCAGLVFSDDGQTLITATSVPDNQITLWRVSDGEKLAGYSTILGGEIFSQLAVTHDLSLAAHTAPDSAVRVMDLATGRERWTAKATDEIVLTVAISPDGKLLATGAGYADGVIRLWDTASGKEMGRLEGHRNFVGALVFWPDGKKLASAGGDQTVRLWDVDERRLLRTLRGHKLEVWSLALLPDNRTLVSGSKDGSVLLWDITKTRAGGAYVTLPKPVLGWRFAADNASILTVDSDGKMERWHGDAFQITNAVLEVGTIEDRNFVEVAKDCPLVAVGSAKGLMKIWDWERGILVREFQATERAAYPIRFLARGGKLLVAYGSETTRDSLHEWDLKAGQETRSWRGPPNSHHFHSGLSPDERWCLLLGWKGQGEGTDLLIDLTTGKVTTPSLNFPKPDPFSYSPDGNLIAAPSQFGFTRIWDASTFREVATLSGFLSGACSAGFSPDNRRLAIGGSGFEAIKLWDVESHENVLTLESRESILERPAFSPDESVFGAKSYSQKGVLNLWRAPSWAEIERTEARERSRPDD